MLKQFSVRGEKYGGRETTHQDALITFTMNGNETYLVVEHGRDLHETVRIRIDTLGLIDNVEEFIREYNV